MTAKRPLDSYKPNSYREQTTPQERRARNRPGWWITDKGYQALDEARERKAKSGR